ncbi:hypothetical protein SDC9_118699 [bioreactor metagenome]|uniref:Uncharacterized protein n=1 Tax=bioreactor metagenome TaxID=1076179 RepID=A0A645C286_9ZZZZ
MLEGCGVEEMEIPDMLIPGKQLRLHGLAVDPVPPDETAAIDLEASFVLQHKF